MFKIEYINQASDTAVNLRINGKDRIFNIPSDQSDLEWGHQLALELERILNSGKCS